MEGKAATCPSDGMFPNYYDCSTYIHCTNGIQYVQPCPEGLIWNLEGGYCDWPENTVCAAYPVVKVKAESFFIMQF